MLLLTLCQVICFALWKTISSQSLHLKLILSRNNGCAVILDLLIIYGFKDKPLVNINLLSLNIFFWKQHTKLSHLKFFLKLLSSYLALQRMWLCKLILWGLWPIRTKLSKSIWDIFRFHILPLTFFVLTFIVCTLYI